MILIPRHSQKYDFFIILKKYAQMYKKSLNSKYKIPQTLSEP